VITVATRLGYDPATLQRCDAKRPCTACVDANRPSDCEYEIVGAPKRPSGFPRFLFRDEPGFSGSKDVSTQEPWTVGEIAPDSLTNRPVATIAQLPPETAPQTRALVRFFDHATPPPCVLPEPGPRTLKETSVHNSLRVTLPPLSTLLSLIPSRIPPEPRITLLSLGPERFQLSDTPMGELDMKLCVSRVGGSSLLS